MKKFAALLLLCSLLVFMLSGCSKEESVPDFPEPTANFEPEIIEETPEPADALPEAVDVPIADDYQLQPTPEPSQSTHNYTLTALNDTSFGYVLAYPTGWRNLPGKHTICFREQVDEGDYPARVAVTKKTFAHTPSSTKVLDQFKAYAETIYTQYDPATFEFGTLNSNAKFLGQQAYEITYLAYSGETEVKGYMICCNVRYDMYVFHFSASYDDFTLMESMMKQIRDTVTIVD